MTSNSFTNRLYLNSDDGERLDEVYNKCRFELGSADIRAKPNQQLTLGVVKAVLPSTIGTFSNDPFVNNEFRLENIRKANEAGTGTVAQRGAAPFVTNGSTLTWYLNGSGVTGHHLVFNPPPQKISTSNSSPASYVTVGGRQYIISYIPFSPKNNIVDLLGMMNAAVAKISGQEVFYFEPDFLKAGLYRIAFNAASGEVIFPWCGTDPTVARAIGLPIQKDTDWKNPQDYWLYNNTTGVPTAEANNPYKTQFFLRDPNLASVLSVVNVVTDYTVDSFSSAAQGVNNIISQIPIEVYNLPSQAQNMSQVTVTASGTTTPTYQTGGDNMLEGTIVFQNNNLMGGHKEIGVNNLNTFVMKLTDSKGQPVNLQGQNYIIEFEAKSSGDI